MKFVTSINGISTKEYFDEKDNYFTALTMLVFTVPFLLYGVLNTAVSQQYETDSPSDCISLSSGKSLCVTINLLIGLVIGFLLLMIALLAFRKRILK